MKVGLCRPLYHTHLITPPLALGYLSSSLKKAGIETIIIDGLNLRIKNSRLAARLSDCDLVGIYCMTDFFDNVIELTGMLKKRAVKVVLGGPHPTAMPYESLEKTKADGVVVGEGEETLLEIITRMQDTGIENLKIPGFVNSAISREGFIPRKLKPDINEIAIPDWEQINPSKYRKAPHGGLIKGFPAAPVITTRGCYCVCSFCASSGIWGNVIRFRKPRLVVDEIEYLVREYGVREIHFEDDNLSADRKHLTLICEDIIRRELDISWCCPNGLRAETLLDDELLALMKKSGCYMLALGIESADEGILNNVRKNTSVEVIGRAIEMIDRAGIAVQGFFIFGLPGETEETIEKTIEFALRSRLLRAQFLFLDILPGTELWEKYGTEIKSDRKLRSFQSVKWVPPTVDEEILSSAVRRAFLKFFMRPRQLGGLIENLRLFQIRYIIQRLLDYNILGLKRNRKNC
ncbi:MAG: radical SAM protein [Elusimicrobiota bacterium]